MRWVRQVGPAVVIVVLAAAPARAQSFISPFIGYNFGGDSSNCLSLRNCEDRRANFGVAIGTRHGVFGVEQDIAYAPDFFDKTGGSDNAVLTLMTNMMVVVPAGPIHPYGVLGIGLIRPHMTLDATSLSLSKNALGYDIGAGVNIYLFGGVAVRGDVRRMKTLHDFTLGVFSNDTLEFWRGSAGLTFKF